jgi:hypothetical protein
MEWEKLKQQIQEARDQMEEIGDEEDLFVWCVEYALPLVGMAAGGFDTLQSQITALTAERDTAVAGKSEVFEVLQNIYNATHDENGDCEDHCKHTRRILMDVTGLTPGG